MTEFIDNIGHLNKDDIINLLENFTRDDALYAQKKARKITDEIYGRKVYIRGLIEISNICKNNCYYCGIRCGNKNALRYRLDEKEILLSCENGYALGFRTFVLQGGEDGYFTDEKLVPIISKIKNSYPDCALTLSLGERSEESYIALKNAGADRYLLRHETATKAHYEKLHPEDMSFENRMKCLENLKKIGYQTGCGMMVGSPFQTSENLADDLLFIRSFSPEMVGMGPFIPHIDTPFKNEKAGSVDLTCFLLSLVRIMLPKVLLPSTTALGAIDETGRVKGLNCGANVIMPNLTPAFGREKYNLYNNKTTVKNDTGEELEKIKQELSLHNYEIVTDRGDAK